MFVSEMEPHLWVTGSAILVGSQGQVSVSDPMFVSVIFILPSSSAAFGTRCILYLHLLVFYKHFSNVAILVIRVWSVGVAVNYALGH